MIGTRDARNWQGRSYGRTTASNNSLFADDVHHIIQTAINKPTCSLHLSATQEQPLTQVVSHELSKIPSVVAVLP